jgi:hypothetical protein
MQASQSSSGSRLYGFEEVTALEAVGPGRFRGDVNEEWTIGGKPNGGYLLAMIAKAATSESVHHDVIAASAHYVGSPEPGAVTIETQALRTGRSASHVRGWMTQGSRLCVETIITLGALDPTSAPYWDGGAPSPGDSEFEDCPRLVPQLPIGSRVAIMEQVEVRLEPKFLGFLDGKPEGRGELRGWLSLPRGEAFTPCSLLFAVDAFPPATFDVEFAGWVPTFEITVYVRALAAPGPVRVLQRAHLIEGQRVDESCFVWDKEGRLVAQATQLAGIRLG